jgi:hypothetical protein
MGCARNPADAGPLDRSQQRCSGRLICKPARESLPYRLRHVAGVKNPEMRAFFSALLNSQASDEQSRHGCCAASAATQPDLAVEELPRKIQMPGMPRRLLDHVEHDPANIWRLEFRQPVLTAWQGRQRSCREH